MDQAAVHTTTWGRVARPALAELLLEYEAHFEGGRADELSRLTTGAIIGDAG